MTATAEEIRAWARAEQLPNVPARGQVPQWLHDAYEERHAHPGAGDDGLDGDVAQAAPPPPGAENGQAAAPPGRESETAPREVKAPSSGRRAAGRLRARLGGGKPAAGKRKRARPKHPRIPVTSMIEGVWGQLAWSARPVPPLSRVLSAQAPFAGVVLEDAVRNTVVDNALQPIARTEELSKAVMGMIGPPAFVMAMLAVGREHPSFGYLHGGLRFSLMSGAKASSMKLEEVMARIEEDEQLGKEIDKLIEWIFSMPGQAPPGQTVEGEVITPAGEAPPTAEDEARLRMQQVFGPAAGAPPG